MQNYTWRAVSADDLTALLALDAACLAVDGPVSVAPISYQVLFADKYAAMHGALAADGALVAVGWARDRDDFAQIGGKVHPQHRRQGLGTALVRWAEGRAREFGKPETFIIRNEALGAGSVALYEQAGYDLDFAEDWMQRDLGGPLPAAPTAIDTVTWTAANAAQFYEVYRDSFSSRPNFDEGDPAEWIADYEDDPDFRPDLSLLAQIDGEPVGFLAAGVLALADLGMTVGWVSQVGVRPAWRGRGIAAALIVPTLAAFAQEGLPAVGLHVNVNNPEAIAAYKKLGFKPMGRRARYSKDAI